MCPGHWPISMQSMRFVYVFLPCDEYRTELCSTRCYGVVSVSVKNLWREKTRLPGLLCGVVFVIPHSAVLVEFRPVTDRRRQTQTRTQAHG